MNGIVKAALALGLIFCASGTAYAHAHLLQSTPAANAVTTKAPGVLRLDFSEGVQLAFTGVTLRGPDGAVLPVGHVQLEPSDDKELLVPLPGALTRGRYTVEWHALSNDGHAPRGTYGFSVAN